MLTCALGRLRRKDYDVIEIYGGEGWLLARLLGCRQDRRFLLASHSNGLEPYAHERLGGIRPCSKWDVMGWMAAGFRAVDRIVTVSEADRQYALGQGYQPESKVLSIENPLSETFLDLKPDFDGRPTRIGFCGSWLPRKGAAVLSRDLTAILKEYPTWTLRLVGVGHDWRARDHFPEEICSRVEVVPFVADKAALRDLYGECAIVVVPSLYESFGLVTAEAMACGCAVVATRTGFAASLRGDVEAVLMPDPESPMLYDGVKRLVVDPVLRQKVAHGGHQRVQTLRWKDAVRRLADFYDEGVRELGNRLSKAA
jgi:glycosyltransferase involved in cell wall biosynthesis